MTLSDINKKRKLLGISWSELSQSLPIKGDSLRIQFKRGSVDEVYLSVIKERLGIAKEITDNPSFPEKTYNTTKKPESGSSRVSYNDIDYLLGDDYGKLLFIKHIHNNENEWLALPEFKKLLSSLSLSSEMESMRMELQKLKNQFEKHIKEVK